MFSYRADAKVIVNAVYVTNITARQNGIDNHLC